MQFTFELINEADATAIQAWSYNERAIRVYERAGFQRVGTYMQRKINGEREFLEMRKKVS